MAAVVGRGLPLPEPPVASARPPNAWTAWRSRWLPRLGLVAAILLLARVENGPVGGLVVGFAVLTPLELLFRRHRQPVRRPGLRTDVFHLLFTGFLGTVAAVVAVVAWWLVLLPVTGGQRNPAFLAQPGWLQAVETVVLLELLGYVAHRSMHEVPLLWRFHRIHHSSATLDWISGARAHPVEGFIGGLIVAPALLLVGIDPGAVGAYTVVVGLWGVLLHANLRWRLRWMDGWWGTPEYHHWHHSNHPEARNRNYAAFLPVLDRLFGTYYQPSDRRPTIYGIDEVVPESWSGQLRAPLRRARSATLDRSMTTAPVPPPPVDDRALVTAIAAGDRAALEALYRIHAGWLEVRLASRCHDAELVDLALQDTFLAVWGGARGFSGQGDVGAWLWGIAVRRLVDQVRRHRPRPVDPALLAGEHEIRPLGEVADSAEAELFASGIGGELATALARLDPELRAVMLVTAVDGLSTKEASVLLGIPQGTVKTRMQRARSQLQALLAPPANPPAPARPAGPHAGGPS